MPLPINYIVRISIYGIYFDSKPMTIVTAEDLVDAVNDVYPELTVYTVQIGD